MTPAPALTPVITRNPNNPVLDEIDQAHAALSPPARAAIGQAIGTASAPSATDDPGAAGLMPLAPAPAAPRRTLGPVQQGHVDELNRLQGSPAGVDQIKHAGARWPLKIISAIGDAVLPGLTMSIPGTQEHHNELVRQARGTVAEDEAQQKSADASMEAEARANLQGAQANEANARIPLMGAQADEASANADRLRHPRASNLFELWAQQNPAATAQDWETFQNNNTHPSTDFAVWAQQNPGKPVSEWLKLVAENRTPTATERPLSREQVVQYNQGLLARYKVNNPTAASLPPEYMLGDKSTEGDFQRIDKLLTGTESAQAQRGAREDSRAERAAAREQKQDTGLRQIIYKTYEPALDSAERFNVMAKNYEDAVHGNQQAMLSLLANHLGMTMGLQKGARLTKDIIQEAVHSRPWLQGIGARFSKDGILEGVALTAPQMQQMVTLGRERFAEDLAKSHSASRYLGATDEGPEREPNASTVRFYRGLAGGDMKKARELAAQDGWTIR